MARRPVLLTLTVALALALPGALSGCGILDHLFPPDGQNGGDGNGGDGNGDGGVEKTLHERILTEILPDGYEGPQTCVGCHSNHTLDLMESAHWRWEGTSAGIEGRETETHGKMDLLNNFCIAIPSNEGRCAQCHPSYGWKSNAFDFTELDNIDCLICHDTTGTYKKHPSANGGGGPPAMMINGTLTVVTAAELQEVAYNVGRPGRQNCGFCHFFAGGGDNVKQGTLSSDLTDPTFEMDVHMGSVATGGQNFNCQECHTEMDHGIAGMAIHSVDEGGAPPNCTRCHGETNVHTANPALAALLNLHLERVACETCHIPTFSRSMATKVAWYWDEAGEDRTDIPLQEGRPTYDKMKGRFVWAKSVEPTYLWYDGKWTRMIVGVSDTYTVAGTEADPVVVAAPTATKDTPGAKIHPFKKMIGRQPADLTNQRVAVPHLFGTATGPNPYWAKFDWNLALQDAAAYTGVPYSGDYGFVNTVMYLRVSHEIAPKEMALGHDCRDCHFGSGFFEALGLADPLAP